MSTFIKDGTGNGFLAAVDDENRLRTQNDNRSHIFHHSLEHENAFNTYWRHIQQVNATNEVVGYFTYTGKAKGIAIRKIVFSTNSAGETKFEVFGNPTTLAGGVDTTPTNFNFGSANAIASTVKDTNNGATPITFATEGIELADIRLGWQAQPTFTYEYDDALIIGPNNTMMILANSATAGDIIRVNVMYYELHAT
jgi:hypothetical protein